VSERTFRIVQGVYLLFALFLEIDIMIYIFIAVFLFEAVSNWRIPMMVTKLRFGSSTVSAENVMVRQPRFNFEAERMLRITVDIFLIGFVLYPEVLWFMPWFLAVMLLIAGITKMCPMVLFFRYFGFR